MTRKLARAPSRISTPHLLLSLAVIAYIGVICTMLAQQEWHSKHIEQSGGRRLLTPREHKEEQERHKNNTLQQQPQQQSGVSDPPRLKFNTTTLTLPRHKKHAYAFYATTPAHACGAMVNVKALLETGTNPDEVDFVIVTYGVNNKQLNEMAAKLNVIIRKVEHLKNFRGGSGYYKDVMVKLRIFQLYEWDRIIYMDADMLVRKNLDHLFFLPDSSHIAGPRVYFQQFPGRPNYFCSCMMVFTPEKHMWDRILTWYKPDGYVKEEKLYDMDLLNREFIDEATVLPGIYEMLSAHLESEDEWKHQLKKVPYMEKKLGMPNKSWEEIYNATSVIHFTGLKPNLEKTLDMIKRKKPKSDSRFYAIYERYFTLASQVCPWEKHTASDTYSKYF
mmetsp:Transcript_36362/g.82924  ORF Transcript_36362/g.82924 Transcript_36362/m.82924 type:complete len:389 (-) Transcript_36362:121-1287(-)